MPIALHVLLMLFFLVNLVSTGVICTAMVSEYKKLSSYSRKGQKWFVLFGFLAVCFAGILTVQLFTLGQGIPVSKNIVVTLSGSFYILNMLSNVGICLEEDMPCSMRIVFLINALFFLLLFIVLVVSNFVTTITF